MAHGDLELLSIYSSLACVGAAYDIRTRKIPNYLNAIIAIAGLGAVTAIGGASGLVSSATHFAFALAIGLGIYALGMWGGGDAKFYAASSAWFAVDHMPRLVIGISLAGLILLAVWSIARRFQSKSDVKKGQLPYGVAIAGGGIVTMAHLTLG